MTDFIDKKQNNSWHPYTCKSYHNTELGVVKTEGTKIYLQDGRILIDAVSSWWSACHGHANPFIVEAVIKQLKILPHIMFAGLKHEPAYELCFKLCEFLNKSIAKQDTEFTNVFLCDSGSVANEVALKITYQYYRNLGQENKNKVVCFKNSYHGDTAGCMAVSDSSSGINWQFATSEQKSNTISLNLPQEESDFLDFEIFIKSNHQNINAFIIEPILQGACGMFIYESSKLNRLCKIIKSYDVLLIFDECATGFYRLGKPFALSFLDISPDIITLSKALTGGFIGLGACVVKQKVFDEFNKEPLKALMHGPTFMANPIACSAAIASIDIFNKTDYSTRIAKIEEIMHRGLDKLRLNPLVVGVRVIGAMGVVEVKADNIDINKVRSFFIDNGIWLRPFFTSNKTLAIYTMPPFIITKEELEYIVKKIEEFVVIKLNLLYIIE
jgi:adenosylmethionine---8-amino-7-oxononanoate aminotransferase